MLKNSTRWMVAVAGAMVLGVVACGAPAPNGGDGEGTGSGTGTGTDVVDEPGTADDPAASRAAFLAAYPVFMHARCVNCHPRGDVPLQFDDHVPHAQLVQRGPDGRGVFGQTCTACHQDANVAGRNMPPGAPDWRMPDATMPLVFEGLSAGDLARQFKDPARNGGKSLAQLLHHVEDDALVKWGWAPGEGRAVPPLSHAEFVAKIREWIATGAHAPK